MADDRESTGPALFRKVLADELQAIATARRTGATPAIEPQEAERAAGEMHLNGLALSGGGIRSATFNLGIIQALCEQRLLERFDYLSTVSGGGYIGSWLSAQLHNGRSLPELEDALRATEDGAAPKAREDATIAFLRQYSNYLTPRIGPASIDTLTAVATYVRNFLVIQATLVTLLITLFLVPRLLYAAVDWLPDAAWEGAFFSSVGWDGVLLVVLALIGIWVNIRAEPTDWKARTRFVVRFVVPPAVLGAFAISIALARTTIFPWEALLTLAAAYALLVGALALLPATHEYYAIVVKASAPWQSARDFLAAAAARPGTLRVSSTHDGKAPQVDKLSERWKLSHRPADGWEQSSKALLSDQIDAVVVRRSRRSAKLVDRRTMRLLTLDEPVSALRPRESSFGVRFKGALGIFAFALVAGVIGCLGIAGLHAAMAAMEPESLTLFAVSLAPFLLLLVFSLTVVIHLGLAGRLLDYQVHEWWARYGAWILEVTIWGGGVFAVAAYGPAILAWAGEKLSAAGGVAWLLTTLWGVLKGASSSTSGETTTWAERLLPAAPFVFIVGLGLALSAAMHPGLTSPAIAPVAFVVFLAAHLLLSWRLDVNLFSLHAFYRNRLTRCYLGAARMNLDGERARKPHPFTGFDPRDDVQLAELRRQRPYHLLNTTLNISTGKNLAWQQRKAASFFFSPLYCGFQFFDPDGPAETCGFADTADYMRDDRAAGASSGVGAMLGSAMAVSGAAVSPNWGYHTSRPVAFLLTLFNLRLGRWCPNPGHVPMPRRQSPALGGWVLLRELLALADAESPYIYLSDGGHFDNLGIYELVRRRASLIVAVDCGEDEASRFDDLGDAVRKCAVDFGAQIELDVDPLKPADLALALSERSLVEGRIRYPAAPGAAPLEGRLVLVKPVLTSAIVKQAPDVRNYRLVHTLFPQQSTADQWFDEAQFESYRKLGYLIGRDLAELLEPGAGRLAQRRAA